MSWVSRCSTCPRPATRRITGRVPGRTCYAALTCTECAPKHRTKAARAGPVVEEPLTDQDPDVLF
ncbi:hypothetical protein [Spongiactinospora sp. TRM90649]|uniref:hypothetical protein n=1 Tax=Spongiactinospora sp. TRM90649 TaxID=3031114 RepID=UPI0023F8D6AC|nr:hypothetical protein [Spongiactinospora sp. TRM90649]MDF5755803.1 hypothetical protein [Spongiactinospora sp. TRM90649]